MVFLLFTIGSSSCFSVLVFVCVLAALTIEAVFSEFCNILVWRVPSPLRFHTFDPWVAAGTKITMKIRLVDATIAMMFCYFL